MNSITFKLHAASRQRKYVHDFHDLIRTSRLQTWQPRVQYSTTHDKEQSINTGSSVEAPLDDYYAQLLSQPFETTTLTRRTASKLLPASQKEAQMQKARVVFGSRLAGPAERRKSIDSKSTMMAGVLVPPRPEEPDNCCMSGCVNCVWDAYRDDIEEWAAKSAEARMRTMMAQRDQLGGSIDDDGGGSETNWDEGSLPNETLFEGVPVGIREFMRTEKVLKDRHTKEGSLGG
ncbi:hypothetical protein MMC06_006197 [Schaereria dolodes]|nr:hypothetical protein [Schaereria dolodes]